MKIVMTVIGVLFFFIGTVWVLQGLNVLPGSFMSGHIQYFFYGLVVDVIGIALVVFGNRSKRKLPPTQGSGPEH